MPKYTIQLTPDSLSKLYWIDMGDKTHVELNDEQLKQLLVLILSNGLTLLTLKAGSGFHPETLGWTKTVAYDDSGQLNSVLEGLKEVKLGIGIIDSKLLENPGKSLVIPGGSRRRGIRKRRRGIRKSSCKSSHKRS